MNLFRYIFNSLFFPTFLSTSILTMIMLMDNIYKFIPFLEVGGIKASFILQMIFFSLPTIFTIALPIGVLMGVYTSIGRLSIDSELIAIRSSGLSFSTIYQPVILFSVIVGLMTGLCSVYLKPVTASALENLKFSLIKQQTEVKIKDKQINRFGDKLIYIFEKIQDDSFKGIIIADWAEPQKKSFIISKRGNLEFDQVNQEVVFHLFDGKIHKNDFESEFQEIEFKKFDFYLELPNIDLSNVEHRFKKKKTYKSDYELSNIEILRAMNSSSVEIDDYYELGAELHSRFVPIFSCIALALIAIPIGITNPRRPGKFRLLKLIVVIVFYNLIYTQFFIMADHASISFYSVYITPFMTMFLSYLYYIKRNNDFNSLTEWWSAISKRLNHNS